ncbi:chromosomal replication initiator protein DnaA [Candidatus Daviesbacteria bacterium]|nr:chromosomal replication initiator protein DnaA [Candidatus Daviesbacteria bacterium]
MDNLSTMDNLRLWHKFLEIIKPTIGTANFKTFFSRTLLKSLEEDKIIISTPHAFAKETLNQKHLPLIEKTFSELLGREIKVEFIVKEIEASEQNTQEDEDSFFQPAQTVSAVLNPRYTLENFVVGPSNNVAYAAAQAVIQNPGMSYNPLFLYGGTGVGKTHLMLGIGNALLAKKKNLKVIYCSSEKFMNDYVAAIQEHKMGDLRRRYRMADILLIDDIQFFSGREGTQEEFFHTFNDLQSKNSQMILTSDRPPQEIAKLEDRLKSRFAGGLMIDIQQPDFDTRVAILRAKCIQQGTTLPEDSLKLIASSLESNTRELEGKLIQILQALKAQNLSTDPENIANYLGKVAKKPVISDHKQVLSSICAFFDVSLKDLTGPKRQKELVLPRHLTMYLLSEELRLTVEKIGQILGGRDHTTIMHGRDKMKKLVSTDREVQRMLTEVKQRMIN